MSDESIELPLTSDNALNPGNNYINNAKIVVTCYGHYLKQDKVTFTTRAVLNFYIVYEINLWPLNLDSKFASLNSLVGTVRLTKNANPDKYSYPGYGIGFDIVGTFSLSDGSGLVKMQ